MIDFFNTWNLIKQQIHKGVYNKNPRSGEIWFCSIGQNIGTETNGKNKDFSRPVLILKAYKNGSLIFPLTSKNKQNVFHYYLKNNSYVKLTQIRFIDSKRFIRIIGHINKKELFCVTQAFLKII